MEEGGLESLSPISPSSCGGVPFGHLELLEATHRGLHKFVPRHHDEIEVEIGDPIYDEIVSKHKSLYYPKYSSLVASLLLIDSSQLTSDSQHSGVNLRSGRRGIFPSAYAVDTDYSDFDPSSPQVKRERYLLGYLGSVETLCHKGTSVLCQAVRKIVGTGKLPKHKPHSCVLEVSDQGLRMLDRSKPSLLCLTVRPLHPFSALAPTAPTTLSTARAAPHGGKPNHLGGSSGGESKVNGGPSQAAPTLGKVVRQPRDRVHLKCVLEEAYPTFQKFLPSLGNGDTALVLRAWTGATGQDRGEESLDQDKPFLHPGRASGDGFPREIHHPDGLPVEMTPDDWKKAAVSELHCLSNSWGVYCKAVLNIIPVRDSCQGGEIHVSRRPDSVQELILRLSIVGLFHVQVFEGGRDCEGLQGSRIREMVQEQRNCVWEDNIESLCVKDSSLWRITRNLMRVSTLKPPIVSRSGEANSNQEKVDGLAEHLES
uniref:(California timema) hypothetical protein n=1 Tax=Timema californicum TaxID=61474 RepID=A0A7R9PDB9_TIMCA|nr:unnamed protein product [Timema californicum]